MKITKVNVKRIEEKNERIKGIASVLLDDCFAIHDIRIIEGKEGLFVAMPSRKNSEGKFKDIAHPINQETRELLENAILDEYNK